MAVCFDYDLIGIRCFNPILSWNMMRITKLSVRSLISLENVVRISLGKIAFTALHLYQGFMWLAY